MIRSALLQGEHRIYIFFVSSQGNKTGSRILEPSSPPSSLHDFYLSLVFDTFSSVGRSKKMFTGHVSVVAKEKRKKKEYNNKVFPIDSTNVILWLRFLFFFFFFNQEFERKREKKRWRVSTFSRCRITIGNALQGGVKKHRSAKKHYKGNNVVSSGCSTYSSVFFFFCFEYLQAISMEFSESGNLNRYFRNVGR